MAKVQSMTPPAAVPFTWVDHRRSVPTTEELENRRNLLGLVNKLTFTNMDTISAQLVEGMKDPYLLSEAVELVFHQGLNPAWMVLFAHLCRRLTKDSPFFGRRGEINFRTVLIDKYRSEFEQAVYTQVPPLVQLCARCVDGSMPPTAAARAETEALLPQELAAYLRERPWVVTPKVLAERWQRMIELVVLLGEFYNVGLVAEAQITWMLDQLCASIEQGVRRNVEPLCRLLATVGPVLDGRRRRAAEHLGVDQDDDDDDDGVGVVDDGINDGATWVDDFVLARPSEKKNEEKEKEKKMTKGVDEYMDKVASYLRRGKEWNLGSRIQFMIMDVMELRTRNWQWRRAS